MAASIVTVTLTKKPGVFDIVGVVEAEIAWTADSTDGTVASTDIVSAAEYLSYLAGRNCILAVTNPGVIAPTSLYDISINDEYGADVFGLELNNRSATASEQATPKIGSDYAPRVCTGIWTFALANNAVLSAAGSCYLYFR